MDAASSPGGQITSKLKRRARQGVDRVVRPYVDEVIRRLDAEIAGLVASLGMPSPTATPEQPDVPAPALDDLLHHALHTARTLALSGMPEVTGTLLSAGPNGKWYFDWFDDAYCKVDRHIAVEAYTPRPDGLPAEVHWVAADISSSEGIGMVPDGEVDLLFSGQNIEHLWPEQVVNFLLEANRVVRPGGWLVVDSPNRQLTAAYRWSMGEHTIEFSATEAQSLLELAGFTVRSMQGLWLCRKDGNLLPLEPTTLTGPEMLERLALGRRHPDDCFIWWAEAVKVGAPNPQALRDAIDAIYRREWSERVSRLQLRDGAVIDASGRITVPIGTTGYPVIGPFTPLRDGSYRFRIPVSWEGCSEVGATVARLEVVVNDECKVSIPITAHEPSGSEIVTADAEAEGPAFASHVRLFCTGSATVQVPLALDIEPEPWFASLIAEASL